MCPISIEDHLGSEQDTMKLQLELGIGDMVCTISQIIWNPLGFDSFDLSRLKLRTSIYGAIQQAALPLGQLGIFGTWTAQIGVAFL